MKLYKALILAASMGLIGCDNDSSSGTSGLFPPTSAEENQAVNHVATEEESVDHEIVITRNAFTPASVTINMGDTVRWTSASNRQESVTADVNLAEDDSDVILPMGAPAINSGMLNPGQQYSYTFMTPGIYQYFTLGDADDGPKGQIMVRDASGNVPTQPNNNDDNNGGDDDGTPDRGPGDN